MNVKIISLFWHHQLTIIVCIVFFGILFKNFLLKLEAGLYSIYLLSITAEIQSRGYNKIIIGDIQCFDVEYGIHFTSETGFFNFYQLRSRCENSKNPVSRVK